MQLTIKRNVNASVTIASESTKAVIDPGFLAHTVLHPDDARQDTEGAEVLFTALAAPW